MGKRKDLVENENIAGKRKGDPVAFHFPPLFVSLRDLIIFFVSAIFILLRFLLHFRRHSTTGRAVSGGIF